MVTPASNRWTYGCEHELADWDTRKGWEGYGRDPEPNICNSNGVATDPRLVSYPFGGEINTPPTYSITAQGELLSKFLKRFPRATVTHRAGLHVHIRVPGLSSNLQQLKKLQRYILENKDVWPLVDPLPLPTRNDFSTEEEYKGAKKRQHWMRMSHWTCVPAYRVELQCRAKTVEEFFAREVPLSSQGVILWHAQPRAAVNLRQLKQTDTIEFRHFSATLSPIETINAIRWCRDFLQCAFDNYPATKLFNKKYSDVVLPLTEPYLHWREKRWQATSITKNKREAVDTNIASILAGTFDSVDGSKYKHLYFCKE